MKYNTQRDKLVMPEYGRTVQNMIQHALTLENREDRQRCAETIVDIMSNMQPQLREQSDFRHKLWDHLAFMSNYELDVDYPFAVTRLDEESAKPQPLNYPKKNIRNRHYGNLVEQLLAHLATMEEGEERDALLEDVANQMNQNLYDWNRDAADPEKIAADVARYTDGRVQLDVEHFKFDSVVQGSGMPSSKRKKKKK